MTPINSVQGYSTNQVVYSNMEEVKQTTAVTLYD